MSLRPAQVQAEEHLRPVCRLGAAGAGRDGQEGRPIVVLTGEEECRPLALEVHLERRGGAVQLGAEVRVSRLLGQLEHGLQLVGAGQQLTPEADLRGQSVRLAEDLLGSPAVVPEAGGERQGVELFEALLLCGEVKDAPRSTEASQ